MHAALNRQDSQGWAAIDSNSTVLDVVGQTTFAGAESALGDGAFTVDRAAAGLAAGTAVGGFVWQPYLKDVRKRSNGTAMLSASRARFAFIGSILAEMPETGAAGLAAAAGALALLGHFGRRRSMAQPNAA